VVAALGSRFGPVHIAVTERAVVGLELRTTAEAFASGLRRRAGVEPVAARHADPWARAMLDRAVDGIERYLRGDREGLDLPVAIVGRSSWDMRVLDTVRAIPWGEVSSYGRVARHAGSPGAARAAGGAVGRNPVGLLVPCHRVIAGDGSLGGYGGTWSGDRASLLELKLELLEHEGVRLPAERLV
ncbi:MAG TPA: methylated-DNA--[protein]-cysteine S-methyltransferase, partial [Candidatus Dormibacteraeota bacterium]|nr:methylated-DNA--[protein]-cysteine S-methyltransferase [Candidatus Dormibacteraeota bacterium]